MRLTARLTVRRIVHIRTHSSVPQRSEPAPQGCLLAGWAVGKAQVRRAGSPPHHEPRTRGTSSVAFFLGDTRSPERCPAGKAEAWKRGHFHLRPLRDIARGVL